MSLCGVCVCEQSPTGLKVADILLTAEWLGWGGR